MSFDLPSEGSLGEPAPYVGRSLPRKDAHRFVSGRVEYSADLAKDAVHLVVVRSVQAHARIIRIEADAARNADGVLLILTGEDVARETEPTPPRFAPERLPGPIELRCLAVDEALYVGQPVCAVVAKTRQQALHAASLIELVVEPIALVLDAITAAEPGSVPARAAWPTNIVGADTIRCGDYAAVRADAAAVATGTLNFACGTSAPMETRSYVADWDARSERLVVRGAFQMPHLSRWMIATALGLAESQVRVVAPAMGGTFGMKMVGHPEEVLVALASKHLSRPVGFEESRAECFLASGREQSHTFEICADANGRITGFRDEMIADVGTIGAGAGWLMALVTPTLFPTVYDISTYEARYRLVTTNKPPWQGVRGYGKEISNAVMERAIDLIAGKLCMDPVEVRRRNLLKPEQLPHKLASGLNIDSGDYPAALEQLVTLFNDQQWRHAKAQRPSSDRAIGIGYAFDLTPEGASFPGTIPTGVETSTVRVEPSGQIVVATSVTSPGTGNETGISQLVADVFGIAPDRIAIVQGDTDAAPFGSGNTSSRSLMFGGAAAVMAAKALREKIAACAADLLKCPLTDLVFSRGEIFQLGSDASVAFKECVRLIYTQAYSVGRNVDLPLVETKSYRASNVSHTPDANGRISSYPSYTYSAHAVAVDVERSTGKVTLLDYAAIHDCGVVVNPALVEGQFKGAIVMGIGAALWEALRRDHSGALTTARFKSFLLPRAKDIPPIRLGHRSTPSPFHPLGLKGAAESGVGGALAAVTNAVADALGPEGAALSQVPSLPEHVLAIAAGQSR